MWALVYGFDRTLVTALWLWGERAGMRQRLGQIIFFDWVFGGGEVKLLLGHVCLIINLRNAYKSLCDINGRPRWCFVSCENDIYWNLHFFFAVWCRGPWGFGVKILRHPFIWHFLTASKQNFHLSPRLSSCASFWLNPLSSFSFFFFLGGGGGGVGAQFYSSFIL